MILSDGSIRERLGELFPEDDITDEQIQPASVDMRLGAVVRDKLYDETRIYNWDETIDFLPGVPYLATTVETPHIPRDLIGTIEGRSSYGRQFLTVHQTAGHGDPGWSGNVTLEVMNMNPFKTISVPAGSRVCQIIFKQLDEPAERAYNEKSDAKYQGQRGPTDSRIDEEY